MPGAASVGALARAWLYVPAGSVVGALAPAGLLSAGRVDNLRRGGGRAPVMGIYVPCAASVGVLAPAALYLPAGSVVGALTPARL